MKRERLWATVQALASRPSVAFLGLAIGVIAGTAYVASVTWWAANGYLAGDTLVYHLSGVRLNSGGDLYSLRPSDPAIFDMRPYGILSPPPIAVPWRVLAVVPGGQFLWWTGAALCATWSVFAVLIGTRGWGGLLVLPLVPSLTLLVGVGNVDAYVLAGALVAWLLLAKRRDASGGVLMGLLACLKVTPAVFLVWLVGAGRRGALAHAVAAGSALLLVATLATSPETLFRYIEVVRGASSGGRPWALTIAGAGLLATLWLARSQPRAAWTLAAILMPIGSPVSAVHSWSLLLIATYPYLLPGASREPPNGEVAGAASSAPPAGTGSTPALRVSARIDGDAPAKLLGDA